MTVLTVKRWARVWWTRDQSAAERRLYATRYAWTRGAVGLSVLGLVLFLFLIQRRYNRLVFLWSWQNCVFSRDMRLLVVRYGNMCSSRKLTCPKLVSTRFFGTGAEWPRIYSKTSSSVAFFFSTPSPIILFLLLLLPDNLCMNKASTTLIKAESALQEVLRRGRSLSVTLSNSHCLGCPF